MDLDKDDIPTFCSLTRNEMASIEYQIFENNWGKMLESVIFFWSDPSSGRESPLFFTLAVDREL